jgi:uncharacterized protein (TIRG00374 family)
MLLAGLAVNCVAPARAGDFLRANWVSRATGSPGGRGLATVVLDRGGDLVVLAAALFVSVPFVTHTPWIDRLVVGAAVLASVFVALVIGARAYSRRRNRDRLGSRGLVRRLARDTLDGLSAPMSAVDLLALLGLSVGAWSAWSCAAILCADALGVPLSPIEAVFFAGVVNLGVAIPSSPGFVGTYQWLVVSTLALYGVGRDEGLAFAVVFQACWYVPTVVVGGALLAMRVPMRARVSIHVSPPARAESASARA